MFRSVPRPHPSHRLQAGVPRHAVQRLLQERDALAQDREALVGEVRRLRQALAHAQAATAVEPEPFEPTDREEELLADIATLQRNGEQRVAQAVSVERGRVLAVVADCYDDVSRAASASRAPSVTGLSNVLSALDDRLSSVGVSRVGAAGESFDPVRHEAVGLDDTHAAGVVVAVASTGLVEHSGRLLRPAKVVVGSGV